MQKTNVVDRKKALEELDEEIKSLNSTSTTQPPPEMSFASQPKEQNFLKGKPNRNGGQAEFVFNEIQSLIKKELSKD